MILVVFLVFGSATTLFYWTKWIGKLVSVVHNAKPQKSHTGDGQWLALMSQAVLMIALCVGFPIASSAVVEPFLSGMFHDSIPAVISSGNIHIMLMMLFTIAILPIAVRILTIGQKKTVVLSYMAGANTGDDRHFTDSFGNGKEQYLANWYMEDYFGEKKILNPSTLLAAAFILVLMGIVIGGAL